MWIKTEVIILLKFHIKYRPGINKIISIHFIQNIHHKNTPVTSLGPFTCYKNTLCFCLFVSLFVCLFVFLSSTCRSNYTVARDQGVRARLCRLLLGFRLRFRFRVTSITGVSASGVAGHRRHGVFHPVQRGEHQREHEQQQAREQSHIDRQAGQRGGGARCGRHGAGGARGTLGGAAREKKTRRRRRRRRWRRRWWRDEALPYEHHFIHKTKQSTTRATARQNNKKSCDLFINLSRAGLFPLPLPWCFSFFIERALY